MPELSAAGLALGGGLLLGLVFGATAQAANFCTMGAVADLVLLGDGRRFRSWVLAIAVALLGSQALHGLGLVDLGGTFYLAPRLDWLGAVLGGALFGFGMTLAGGCGNRNLVRLGGGSLKALIVILMLAVFAYMTMRGLLALPRLGLASATGLDLARAGLPNQGLPELAAAATGVSPGLLQPVLAVAIGALLIVWCFKDAGFRRRRRDVVAGLVIGALVPAGWAVTGILGADDFEPVPLASMTFVAPIGETLVYLMTFTGASLSFGVTVVAGVVLGAAGMSLLRREFRLEGFQGERDMLRHLCGGALMGIGGVLAGGCTIGQGLTGLATMGLGSALAFGSILAGAWLGIRYQEEGSLGAALKGVFVGE